MTVQSSDQADTIRERPISAARWNAFRETFQEDRKKTATIEMLFSKATSIREEPIRPRPEEIEWTGFNLLLQKAPFTDLPNWGPYRAWDFAVALEVSLLNKLEQALRTAVEDRQGDPVERKAQTVLQALDSMAFELDQNGYFPDAFVLAGQLGEKLVVELQKSLFEERQWIQRDAPGATFRIMGRHRGVPVLDLPDSPSPAVYAVDLARFATLTRYGAEPEMNLKPIDANRAKDLLAQNPRLISDLPKSPEYDAERIRQLQMKVEFQLFETYKLEVKDTYAAVGSPLVGDIRD